MKYFLYTMIVLMLSVVMLSIYESSISMITRGIQQKAQCLVAN